ncbi:MAG: aminopeptidase [Christensenellaceae bacterium]
MSKLSYQRKNLYASVTEEELSAIHAYAEGYKSFIDSAKTEREAVSWLIQKAKAQGYTPYRFGEKLQPGDKRYFNNHNKNLYLLRVGTEDVEENGVRIVAAHLDSPRLDLKQDPLYEKNDIAFFKTHYYGGIKKYQWTTIPLALHGTVFTAEGEKKEFRIGDDPSDPVFYVSDLLPHLAAKQMQKSLAEAIDGESLNIWAGNVPTQDEDESSPVSAAVLRYLYEKYSITEEDFHCAEISAVPATGARDVGFDRALIGAYGHDDRVCAYTQFTALMEETSGVHTVMAIFADKEEIGSFGATGMQSEIFIDLMNSLADNLGANRAQMRYNSKCLSADVAAAYDPNFADVYEYNNTSLLSHGAGVFKYTGSRGKTGSNDAPAELLQEIRTIFSKGNVVWQMGELGKVDAGGGGTVAKFISRYNIATVDLGVPVISMHSPFELISKADLFETQKAFSAFLTF